MRSRSWKPVSRTESESGGNASQASRPGGRRTARPGSSRAGQRVRRHDRMGQPDVRRRILRGSEERAYRQSLFGLWEPCWLAFLKSPGVFRPAARVRCPGLSTAPPRPVLPPCFSLQLTLPTAAGSARSSDHSSRGPRHRVDSRGPEGCRRGKTGQALRTFRLFFGRPSRNPHRRRVG